MDVIGGLTAAKLALDLAKDLKDIDRSVDEAGYKLTLAELTSALADTRVALADAKVKILDFENELAEKSSGSLCPVCQTGRLKITKVERSEYHTGIEFHDSSCDNDSCSYVNKRKFDAGVGQYFGRKT